MSLQTWSNIVIVIGLVLTAAGSFGSYYFGKIENEKKEKQSAAEQRMHQNSINSLNEKVHLLFESSETKKHSWNEVKVRAPIFSKYIMVLFKSSSGEIAGNARIKGTKKIYPFSSKMNNRIPLAVHNLYLSDKKQYMSDPILEYEITETSDEKNTLSIFSAGFSMGDGM